MPTRLVRAAASTALLLLGAAVPPTRAPVHTHRAVTFLAPGNYLLKLSALSGTTTLAFTSAVALTRTADTVWVRQGTTIVLNGVATATSGQVYGSSGSGTVTLSMDADRTGGGTGRFAAHDAHGDTVRGRATLAPVPAIGFPLRERTPCGTFWNCMKATFHIY